MIEVEGAAIRDAAQRVLAGKTFSSIVAGWNRKSLPTASGGPWRVNSLSSLLLKPGSQAFALMACGSGWKSPPHP